MDVPPRLRMFAGPIGSGKTTLVRMFAREFSREGLFQLHTYVNADDILGNLVSGRGVNLHEYSVVSTTDQLHAAVRACGRVRRDHPFFRTASVENSILNASPESCDAYVAAAIADYLRLDLLERKCSFSFETVMSHRNKVDFFARARENGYRTYLYFVATDSSDVNLHRVKNRVGRGGHSVPDQKVVERYRRCIRLLPGALAYADRAYVFDNSRTEPELLAELTPDRVLRQRVSDARLPQWFQNSVIDRCRSGACGISLESC